MKYEKFYSISYKINDLLSEYITVHNNVLAKKILLREIIPIPFIFKPIDFSFYVSKLDKVIEELAEILNELKAYCKANELENHNFYITASRYVNLLLKSIISLRNIQNKLYDKSQGNALYSYKEYKKELDLYKLDTMNYCEFGTDFNKAFYDLRREL